MGPRADGRVLHPAVLIREATFEDSEQLAGVHTRSWQVAYRGQLPDALLAGLDPRDRVAGWQLRLGQPASVTTLVAIDGRSERIVGFIVVGPTRDGVEDPNRGEREDTGQGERPDRGEVYAIYVDPPWWGRSIGADLLLAGMDRLRRDGFTEATLWVLGGNQRTHRFYERHGWRPDGRRRTERIGDDHPGLGDTVGIEVDEVRYAITLPTSDGSA